MNQKTPRRLLVWPSFVSGENKEIFWGVFFSALVFFVYVTSPVVTSFDSRWSIHTSRSILREGNIDLNEYEKIIEENDYYAIKNIDGNLYTFYPVGASCLAVPFVAVADLVFAPLMSGFPAVEDLLKSVLAKHGKPVEKLELVHLYQPMELLIASLFCALTAFFIFQMARTRLPLPTALFVVFVFAFCTSSWSTSSRALWQHGPSMLMLSITLYLIILEDSVAGVAKYAAIPLAIAFVVRPTNAIPIFFITGYIFLNRREQIIKFLLIASPFAAAFFIHNILVYDALLPWYFSPHRVFRPETLVEALAGNLVSPSRGLFVYSSILLFSIFGIIKNSKEFRLNSISIYLVAILFFHWIMISSFPHWWAGHSYGPRLFADMIPFFMYFIIQFFADFDRWSPTKKRVVAAAMVPLLVSSFYVNARGAYSRAGHQWNVTPTNIDASPERLWDWTDPQFLR